MTENDLLLRLGAPPCRFCPGVRLLGGVPVDPTGPYRVSYTCIRCEISYYLKPTPPPDDMVPT